MHTFRLQSIVITYRNEQTTLLFTSAELVVVTEYGDRLWYIDVNGVEQKELLEQFAHSEDIRVEITSETDQGQILSGVAYLHPNPAHRAAALRGDGVLLGL
ncbi:hypothetical protein ACFO9Q_09280 [Paenibacillus sp. GCM10023252]|uniref:hypothetical protein n=1 Tax=Paenibacillus sp. GCM10023252 TaxID=3252649 RepID=UPI0036212D41